MFKWIKKGLIFSPNERHKWMNSYAQVPYAIERDNYLRIYFSTRESKDNNCNFKSYSAYVDVDKNDPRKIISIAAQPILNLGNIGEFDEFGAMAGSIVEHEGRLWLYYCGWTRLVSVPYNWAIGLAHSVDGGVTFKRFGCGPIVGPTHKEPYLQACPIVFKRVQHEWHMFYLSGVRWIKTQEGYESQYLIMHATSNNGIAWKRNGNPVIPIVIENECQTSASIIDSGDVYHMFFSYRYGTDFRINSKRSYRIGYAWSKDLITWYRDDSKAGIEISQNGWDSEMVCYPHVIKVDNRILLFYCGNYFGKDGFGYAVLED